MDSKQIKDRMIQLEEQVRTLAPQTVKKSSIDVDYAVKTGQYSICIAEHNMLNAMLGIHEELKIIKELIIKN